MSDFETGSALTMSDDEDPTFPTLCLSMSPDPTRSTRVGGDLDDLDAVTCCHNFDLERRIIQTSSSLADGRATPQKEIHTFSGLFTLFTSAVPYFA